MMPLSSKLTIVPQFSPANPQCPPRHSVLWDMCHDPPYPSNCPYAWMASVPLASAIFCHLNASSPRRHSTPCLFYQPYSDDKRVTFNFFFSEVISRNLAMATLFKTTEYHSMFPFAQSTFYFLTCMLFCPGCTLYCLPCTFLEMSQDVC